MEFGGGGVGHALLHISFSNRECGNDFDDILNVILWYELMFIRAERIRLNCWFSTIQYNTKVKLNTQYFWHKNIYIYIVVCM